MLETKDLYKDYISGIQLKMTAISVKIDQYYKSQTYLRTCIYNNKGEFEKLGISVDNLFSNPHIAYAKIKDFVDNGQLTRVAHYVKSYVNSVKYLNLHKLLYDRLSKALIPYELYIKVIAYANLEIAKYILEGGIYKFGHVGKLYIKEKPRTFMYNGKPVQLPVDWGMSNKYKQELIKQGKVPYDSVKAPNGVKWHCYHDSDFGYWFWWEAGPIPHRAFFKFYPSKFCKVRQDRRNATFLKQCKSKDEIYNGTNLGLLDKMLLLMRFDPLHFINYRRAEKEKEPIKELELVNN
jgi:hypothetical protein